MKPIRVLIVDDSPVVRRLLREVISFDDGFTVVAEAINGQDAVEKVMLCQPDIVTMDIQMPVLNGFEATRRIMTTNPVPIVVVANDTTAEELNITFKALQAGALTVLEKPRLLQSGGFAAMARRLTQTLRLMSEIHVVRRHRDSDRDEVAPPLTTNDPLRWRRGRLPELVAIGASTGGPQAILTLLRGLPANYPVPIVVVQHIAPGFAAGMATWLDSESALSVTLATDGAPLVPGRVALAPAGQQHLVLDGDRRLALVPATDGERLAPSVDRLFESVAAVSGARALGILLTGMGADGARGMKALFDSGADTWAQDEATSVVYGMPAEARRRGGVRRQLSLDAMARDLLALGPDLTPTWPP